MNQIRVDDKSSLDTNIDLRCMIVLTTDNVEIYNVMKQKKNIEISLLIFQVHKTGERYPISGIRKSEESEDMIILSKGERFFTA